MYPFSTCLAFLPATFSLSRLLLFPYQVLALTSHTVFFVATVSFCMTYQTWIWIWIERRIFFPPCQSVTNSGQNSQFLHTFSFSHHLLICKFVAAHTKCPCVEEDGSLIYSFLGECGLKVHSSFSCLVIVHHCTVSPISCIVCVCMCSLCSLWQECSHRLDNMSAITGHWSLLSYCSCPQTHTHCFSLPFTYLFFKVLFLISFLAASILF